MSSALAENLREPSVSRDDLKRLFLRDVVAKRGKYPSLVEDTFGEHFPTVHEFIQAVDLPGKEHKNLIRRLQQVESKFVIETVAADLVKRSPRTFFITLHDAIFTTAEQLPRVEQAFQRGFEQTGFRLTLKVAV